VRLRVQIPLDIERTSLDKEWKRVNSVIVHGSSTVVKHMTTNCEMEGSNPTTHSMALEEIAEVKTLFSDGQ
jgi:hypothetical protein